MKRASARDAAVLFVAAALGFLAASSPAADGEPYLVEYRAYMAALEVGDAGAAATHARAAWRAAEQALGDHRLTAILAFNYGRLIIFATGNEARAPLSRASDLQNSGVADLPREALRLYLSYAEFAASGFEEDAADRLRGALDAVPAEDETLRREVAAMWLSLATQDVVSEEYEKAVDSAAKAEAAIRNAYPDASRGLAEAILLGAIARVVPWPRKVENVQAALDGFGRARRLFPPQQNVESFDPLLAKILTWKSVTEGALLAMEDYDASDRTRPDSGEGPPPPLFVEDRDCAGVEWDKRKAPRYPRGAMREGFVGTVMLGYRLGEDLQIHDARVLAEVPAGEGFGDAVLKILSDWRAKGLPDGGAECTRNLVMHIKFVLEP